MKADSVGVTLSPLLLGPRAMGWAMSCAATRADQGRGTFVFLSPRAIIELRVHKCQRTFPDGCHLGDAGSGIQLGKRAFARPPLGPGTCGDRPRDADSETRRALASRRTHR